MNTVVLEIMFVLILILINGFFAMSEIALVSARKVRLEQKADEGDKGAKIALDLSSSTTNLLSAVQVGITLVGILTGALGGATVAERLAEVLKKVSWLEPYASGVSIAIVVLLTTYFSLVIGELIPKRLALNNPEKIAAKVAGVMRFLSKATAPIVHLLSASTNLGMRILGVKPSTEPPVTEEEIKILLEEGTQVGVFGEAEHDMMEGILRLNDRSINAIMTPRTEIEWLDANDSHDQILDQILASPYSRFPVARGSLDDVVGILSAKDVLEMHITKPEYDLLDLIQKPLFVPENTPAMRVLDMVREAGVHEALVIDEYGGLLGMITLFDVLESIVGEIPSYESQEGPEIVKREDGSFLLDGLLPVDQLKELLDIDELPDEKLAGFQTVGGFVMHQLGAIPVAGQHFHWLNYRFEIIDMDERRVDKVLVNKYPTAIAQLKTKGGDA
jgi:putative hemolysin